ncbi:MAG: methyltransferase family protein [Thermoplasmatota archaeon]
MALNGGLVAAPSAAPYVVVPWAIWFGIWIVTALRTSRARERESGWVPIAHRALLVVGWVLLLAVSIPIPPLDASPYPISPASVGAGVAVEIVGLAFSVWARFALGRNWSSSVTIKVDHELVMRGPYRWVRHPIYTGILTGALGTAIAFGAIRCYLGFAFILVSFLIKLHTEEVFMRKQFGAAYEDYRRKVAALLPFVY